MADPVVDKLEALKRSLLEQIEVERLKLAKVQAKADVFLKRISELQKTLATTERQIDRLLGTAKNTGGTTAIERATPFEWGDGSRIAFALLREEKRPISAPDLARKALALHGIDAPPEKQLRAMARLIYAAFRDQVTKGRIKVHATTPRTYSVVSGSAMPLAVTLDSLSEVV